ncbi:MAG TPA: hypothetical protein VKU85_17790, partial [bacterium]|nr:hypothetical protein [bacterium]
MSRNLPPGFPPLRFLALLLLAFAPAPADAGVRTRVLPDLPGGVEPELRARAAAAAPARLHALAEVPRAEQAAARAAGMRLLRSAGGDLWL